MTKEFSFFLTKSSTTTQQRRRNEKEIPGKTRENEFPCSILEFSFFGGNVAQRGSGGGAGAALW